MSIEMMTLVWHHSTNSGSVLLLELAIADHAHDDGTGAYPSNERLAIYARGCERNIRYIIAKLLESKEVSVEYNAGPHGANLYTINVKLLRRLPDQIPTRRGGQRLPGGKDCPRGAKIAGGQKRATRGAKFRKGGAKNRRGGAKNAVSFGGSTLPPNRNHHKNHQRTVKEPSSSSAPRDDTELERIDRNMQKNLFAQMSTCASGLPTPNVTWIGK